MEQGLMTTNPIAAEDWPSAWVRDVTLIRFLVGTDPDNEREIAIIDGVTGLKWVLLTDEPGSPWVVDESVWPVADHWIFEATYLVGDGVEVARGFRTIREEGFYGGDGVGYAALQAELMAQAESPWEYPGSAVIFTTYAERTERLDICHACPFFDHRESTCTIDGSFMHRKTIDSASTCPDDPPRWGQAASYDEDLAALRLESAVVHAPVELTEEQLEFEAEWQARHAG
jgi:hypothetical protein